MKNDQTEYDSLYSKTINLFGSEPETCLQAFETQIPKGPVLDIGAGQGRNALFLAETGFEVHALEPSKEGIRHLKDQASLRHLNVKCIQKEFGKYNSKSEVYSAVLVFGLIQILSAEDRQAMIERVPSWLVPGGLLFLTGFGTQDPSMKRVQMNWHELTSQHFVSPEQEYRFYLKPGQVSTLFPGYQVLHLFEGWGPWHRHGDSEPERHDMVELVARKPVA